MQLYDRILSMAARLGFSAAGCAEAAPLEEESVRYENARKKGCFASMEYLGRNMEKRADPRLLVPGAKSVLVFLAPFGRPLAGCGGSGGGLKVSEFAHGLDYHKVIKDKLYLIAQLIKDSCAGEAACRVFTDSAPVMERAWAVRAGLGFIGKNNFLISPVCGVKNFIGVIITSAELPCFPYGESLPAGSGAKEAEGASAAPGCGDCTRCIEACRQHALSAPYTLDASKCLSYKTIESRSLDERIDGNWIFGCDDCMNACPWNSRNRPGWPEFAVNRALLENTSAGFWNGLSAAGFGELFSATPLERAGIEKIKANVNSCLGNMKKAGQ